ncbi:MAG TPA: VOC family protein [Mucilaginibacter sp.]
MKIKLIVLRTGNMDSLVEFYQLLGVTFNFHKHGDSPYHYSAIMDQMVLEVYPLTKSQTEADKSLRLGFELDNFDMTIEFLKKGNVVFVSGPAQTEFGFMATVIDPDGRKIELYKN